MASRFAALALLLRRDRTDTPQRIDRQPLQEVLDPFRGTDGGLLDNLPDFADGPIGEEAGYSASFEVWDQSGWDLPFSEPGDEQMNRSNHEIKLYTPYGEQIRPRWDLGDNISHNSETYKNTLIQTVQRPRKVVRGKGKIDGHSYDAARTVDQNQCHVSSLSSRSTSHTRIVMSCVRV